MCQTLVVRSLAVAVALAAPALVHAQASQKAESSSKARVPARSQVIVFRVAPSERSLRQTASALDPLLLGEISKRNRIVAQHALDLPSTQLALDCMAETPDCLRAVMQQPGTDSETMIAPTLERSGSELVLSVLYFSGRDGDELRHATRRGAGPDAQRAILDSVPSLIDELFARSGPRADRRRMRPGRAQPAPIRATQRTHHDSEPSSWPVVPVALTSVGVAFLSAGVAFGLSARAAEKEHARAVTGTDAQADAASETFERAETHATLATVGLAAGASAITAGVGLWLFDSAGDSERPSARLVPRISRGGAGLVFESRFVEPQP